MFVKEIELISGKTIQAEALRDFKAEVRIKNEATALLDHAELSTLIDMLIKVMKDLPKRQELHEIGNWERPAK